MPNKPSVPTPPPVPVISLPKTVIKLVSNLDTSPSLSDHGGRKSPFRIDAKLFSFSFNGGRHDSYVVHESSRHVKHTIWVGRKGLEWILSCFADIWDWVPGNVSICKRFWENNKLLEFCGRSNKAGVYVVIAEYYGRARQGCVMIPASSNRAGWSLFQRELRNFSIGAKPGSMVDVSSKNGGGGGGQSAGSDRSENLLSASGNQQKIKNFEKFGAILGQNRFLGVPVGNGSGLNGNVSVINGRPTRACTFKLTPEFLALRACKFEGGKHTVTNLGAKDVSWPKVSSGGPEILNQFGELVKAHPVDTSLVLKGTLVKPGPFKASFDGQSSWAEGENSRGIPETVSGSPVPATVPVSSTEGFGSPVTSAVPASATEGSNLGFSGVEVRNRRLRDVTHTLIDGVLRGGATARPMGLGFDAQNSFSPLSCLGSEEDLCFGRRDDTTGFRRQGSKKEQSDC